MRRLAAILCAVITTASCFPAASAAKKHRVSIKDTYSAYWHKCAERPGCNPGRNIRRQGIRYATYHHRRRIMHARRATMAEYHRSTRTLRRWTGPPMTRPMPGDGISALAAKAGGGYAIPVAIVRCESGGSYGARNPSGAGGAYQMMPGTFHSYGGVGDPASAPPAAQDAAAARLYAAQGTAPWNASRACWG